MGAVHPRGDALVDHAALHRQIAVIPVVAVIVLGRLRQDRNAQRRSAPVIRGQGDHGIEVRLRNREKTAPQREEQKQVLRPVMPGDQREADGVFKPRELRVGDVSLKDAETVEQPYQ